MSKRWGSDYVVAEHRDLQANTMAVDATGSFVLLAGYFAVKHLDEGTDTLRKFHRQSKYEVGSAEWNPNRQSSHLCAISSNNRIEVLCFDGGDGFDLTTSHSLKAHTRVVSDLNWHPTNPDILASCSIDTFIHIWDIRDQRKPSLSLSAVAAASQVKWNCLSSYILATAHDGDIKIWDQRKGNNPMQYIAAHLTKIHGLDWCPFQRNQLATSSQDCTAKLFDISNPRRAENILTTSAPVWRARYTPFGEGLITIVVPQLRRGENSLLLWNTSNFTAPIYTFLGHTDVVLEFQWRHRKQELSDFELITWSKDQCLRIFKIDPFLQKLCGHDLDDGTSEYTQYPEDNNLGTLRSMQQLGLRNPDNEKEMKCIIPESGGGSLNIEANYFTINKREVSSPTQPKTLQQEFSLININIPNIEVNAMDADQRSCTVTASNENYNVILKVNFPENYPYNASPSFQFCPGTTIDNATMAKLSRVLKQTAQQRIKKNRSCLEPCLRQLIITLEQMCVNEESEGKPLTYRMPHSSNFMNSGSIFSNYHDTYIPFPRTSGAKFCCVGPHYILIHTNGSEQLFSLITNLMCSQAAPVSNLKSEDTKITSVPKVQVWTLVCFGRSSYLRRPSVKLENTTPRSLSALGPGMNNGGHFSHVYPPYSQSSVIENMSISSFYSHERKNSRRSLHRPSRPHSRCSSKIHPTVTIYDASLLFFVNKELAEKYIINITDIPGMCQYNAGVAASLERPDLVQSWYLAALVISRPLSDVAWNPNQFVEGDAPWPLHPFGRNLIHSLIQHYASQSDIQMAGMLSCTFNYRSEKNDPVQGREISKSVNVSPGGSPYHTIHPADTSLEGWNFQNLKQHRSNSWSESLDDLKIIPDSLSDPVRNIRLSGESNTALYDSYKKAYSEVLHRWRLLDARAQVLKHVSAPSIDSHKAIEFQIECYNCDKPSPGPQCVTCRQLAFQCVICHISVRGLSNVCIVCGHGGHTHHLNAWFATETLCPTGCGCHCLKESITLLIP